jgi:hypothetical protein
VLFSSDRNESTATEQAHARHISNGGCVIPKNHPARRQRETGCGVGDSLKRSYCCSKDMTRGGSRPRRPSRSRSVMGNAVSCADRGGSPGELGSRSSRSQGSGGGAAYLVVPWVVKDVIAALVHDAGAWHDGASAGHGGGG